MTDPRRLLEARPSELEAALLRVGRTYRASERARAKTLAALGVVSSSLLGAKIAVAGVSLKALLLGGAVAVAVVAGSTLTADRLSRSHPTVADDPGMPASPPELDPGQHPAAGGALGPIQESGNAAATAPQEELTPPPAPEPPAAAAPKSVARPPGNTSIAAELRALDAARRALSSGDGRRALRLLDAHGRDFPQGRLGLEAEVLRIEALAQTGNRGLAATRARGFLERYPESVFAPRVKRLAGR